MVGIIVNSIGLACMQIIFRKDLHKIPNRVNITHQVEVILFWIGKEERC